MYDSDRIKRVIKGIEQCMMDRTREEYETQCVDCPYCNVDVPCGECMQELKDDVIALLKEQEHTIEELEYNLAVTESNINYYINGNR